MFEKIEKLTDSLWLNEILYKYSTSESKEKKFGVCDDNMKIILPIIFDEIEMSADKQIVGKINGKLYYFKVIFIDNKTKAEMTSIFYIDSKGQIVEDEEIFYKSRINEISENLWIIYSDEKKKFGAVNSLGNVIIPFDYDYIANNVTDGQCEFIFAIKDNKYGMFDKSGNIVIPVMYEHLEIFKEDLAAAKLNEKYGFIDIHNEVKIPFVYDKVIGLPAGFENGLALVEADGEKFYIDKNGERIVK